MTQGGDAPTNTHRGEHKEFFPDFEEAYVDGQLFVTYSSLDDGYTVGHEFEAQGYSAAFTTNAAAGTNNVANDPLKGTPYYSHRYSTIGIASPFNVGALYIPSVDDQRAFSGTHGGVSTIPELTVGAGPTDTTPAMPPLDGGTYTVYNANGVAQTVTTANVWLKLNPLVELDANGVPRTDGNGNPIPIRPADGKGGILYGATWTTPSEASDWYMDVICYDNAVNPFDPTSRSNVIVYDNVWGFSTAPSISGLTQDILVVSDYALGQKFFRSRFGDQPTNDLRTENLQPIFYGSESYFTDFDLRRIPSERRYPESGAGNTLIGKGPSGLVNAPVTGTVCRRVG